VRQTAPMEPARHLEILRAEIDLVAALPASALDAPIPTVEEWTVEGVVRHLGRVHSWVTGALLASADQTMADLPPPARMPKGPECLEAYREAADGLLAAFDGLDPSDPKPTFAGPGSAGWWMRRQAQEVSVHRIDAQDGIHAAGGPATDPLAVDGAADGIDEWARMFVAERMPQRDMVLPNDLHGCTIHIHGTDDPAPADGAEWLLTVTDEGAVTVEATHAKGDVALRGPAETLLLALWRRRPLSDLDVVGDASVAERLLDVVRI
jgi:uncharacterized protein (TIGR03083 family)